MSQLQTKKLENKVKKIQLQKLLKDKTKHEKAKELLLGISDEDWNSIVSQLSEEERRLAVEIDSSDTASSQESVESPDYVVLLQEVYEKLMSDGGPSAYLEFRTQVAEMVNDYVKEDVDYAYDYAYDYVLDHADELGADLVEIIYACLDDFIESPDIMQSLLNPPVKSHRDPTDRKNRILFDPDQKIPQVYLDKLFESDENFHDIRNKWLNNGAVKCYEFEVEIERDKRSKVKLSTTYPKEFKLLIEDLLKCVVFISDGNLVITKDFDFITDKRSHKRIKMPSLKLFTKGEWVKNFVERPDSTYQCFEIFEKKNKDGTPMLDKDGEPVYERHDLDKQKSVYMLPLLHCNFRYDKIDTAPYSPLAKPNDSDPELRVFRTFRGFAAKMLKKVDKSLIKPLLDHFKDVWADGNEDHYKFILKWLAHCFRHPDEQSIALVLTGEQGTGKTSPMEFMMKHIWGYRYSFTLSSIDEANIHFNFHLLGKMLINVQEVEGDNYGEGSRGRKKATTNKLKSKITDELIQFNKKFGESIMASNTFRWFLSSNYSEFLHLTEEDRRYFIKEVSNRYGTGKKDAIKYHQDLRKSFTQEVANHLFTYLLTDPEFNVDYQEVFQNIPMTETKRDVIDGSRDKLENFIIGFAQGSYTDFKDNSGDLNIVDNTDVGQPIGHFFALVENKDGKYLAMTFNTLKTLHDRLTRGDLDQAFLERKAKGALKGYLRIYRPNDQTERICLFYRDKMTWWNDKGAYLKAYPYLVPKNEHLYDDSGRIQYKITTMETSRSSHITTSFIRCEKKKVDTPRIPYNDSSELS